MFFHELSDSCRTPSVFCELDLFAVSLTTLTPVRLVKETWSVNSQNRATTRGRRPSPCEPRVPRRTCFFCELESDVLPFTFVSCLVSIVYTYPARLPLTCGSCEIQSGNSQSAAPTREKHDCKVKQSRHPFTTTANVVFIGVHTLSPSSLHSTPQFISLSSWEYSNRKSPFDRWHHPPSWPMLTSK